MQLIQAYPAGNITVVGAIAGFGTHNVTEPALASHSGVPTIIVTGLLDDISPAYDNNIFYDPDAPSAKGTFDFYEELDQLGYPARILISAQKGHGWASFGKASGSPWCSKTIPDFAIDQGEPNVGSMADHYALAFFFHTSRARTFPTISTSGSSRAPATSTGRASPTSTIKAACTRTSAPAPRTRPTCSTSIPP